MSIDPILPLSISMAEGKGTYALFLGSGISSKAGVPTGLELLNKTKERLYLMDKELKNIADSADYQEWINNENIDDINYSELIGMFPSEEDRRSFLEPFFVDSLPTDSHRFIAKMVEKQLVKVIITTNFDRLLESALEDNGLEFDVMSSSKDLDTLKPREHSKCRIMKVHGDYKSLNIKNTKKELDKLENRIEDEFQQILNNYGIIVVGYSGSDNGVMSCFKKRNSKYTLYWLKRGDIESRIDELIKNQDGRFINRSSSDEFFIELYNKINYYNSYESVETPEFLIQLLKSFIREDDRVNYKETLKKQMRVIEDNWFSIYDLTVNEIKNKNPDALLNGFIEFEKNLDLIISIGLTLIEHPHSFIDNFFSMFQKIYDLSDILIEERSGKQNYLVSKIPRASIFNLFHVLGALCLKEEYLAPIGTLFQMEIIENNISIQPEPIWNVVEIFFPDIFNQDQIKIFNFLIESYDDKYYLKEFFRSKNEFKTYLCQFNFLLCLYISKQMLRFPKKEYGFNPIFARFRTIKAKIDIPIVKFESNRNYRIEMAKVFEEESTDFYKRYEERCQLINKTIDTYPYKPSIKLLCDRFYKN